MKKRHQIWIEIIHAILRITEAIIKQLVACAKESHNTIETINSKLSEYGVSVGKKDASELNKQMKASMNKISGASEIGRKLICYYFREISDSFGKSFKAGFLHFPQFVDKKFDEMSAKIFAL